MAKQKISRSPGLEKVMDWLLKDHTPEKGKVLNIDRFLDGLYDAQENIDNTKLQAAIRSLESDCPDLKKEEIEELQAILRGEPGYYNAYIQSPQVLRFMRDLIHRRSTIPPPWRA